MDSYFDERDARIDAVEFEQSLRDARRNRMQRLSTPESSTIAEIAYDEKTSYMTVHFKSKYAYEYQGVSKEAWDKFTSAESKGKYFAESIKNRYTGRKL